MSSDRADLLVEAGDADAAGGGVLQPVVLVAGSLAEGPQEHKFAERHASIDPGGLGDPDLQRPLDRVAGVPKRRRDMYPDTEGTGRPVPVEQLGVVLGTSVFESVAEIQDTGLEDVSAIGDGQWVDVGLLRSIQV